MTTVVLSHAQTFNQTEILVSAAMKCRGKEPHDRATANRIVRKTRKVRLESYHCDVCHHWHVGVPRSGKRTIKRSRMREFGGEQ